MLKPGSYEVLIFQTSTGNQPFLEWLDGLAAKTQERVVDRVARLRRGQFGDFKSLENGLYELRLFFGPGYRVYFGEHRKKIVLILNGGDKSSQKRDIKLAQEFWSNYLEDNK